MGLNYFN
jgi:hypothetical protein